MNLAAAVRAHSVAPITAALLIAALVVSAVALADSVIAAATIKLAGASCAAGSNSVRPGVTVIACGNVYLCSPVGASYAGNVLNFPGPCRVDRVYASGFDL